jgi:hypothetical protein
MVKKRSQAPKAVTESERWRLPSDGDLDRFSEETEALKVVVLGFQWLDALLWLALSDNLPGANVDELRGLKMTVKVDIAIGLGLVHPDERPVLRKLNSIRNQFVHEQKVNWTWKDAREMAATWSQYVRQIARKGGVSLKSGDALEPLRVTMMLEAIRLQAAIKGSRDHRTKGAVSLEGLRMVLRTPRLERPWSEQGSVSDWIEEETQRRVEARRARGML